MKKIILIDTEKACKCSDDVGSLCAVGSTVVSITCHTGGIRVLVHVLHVLHQGGASEVHFVAEWTVDGVRPTNQCSVLKRRFA